MLSYWRLWLTGTQLLASMKYTSLARSCYEFVNRRAYTLQFRHSNRSSGRSCQIQLTFRADSNLNSRRVSEGTFRCC